MATTATGTIAPPPLDPFRYGWRYVVHNLPDGEVRYEQLPLTLEDVLHPEEGDFIVQNAEHARLCRYLADVCEAQLADDPSAVVLSDVRVAWDEAGERAHGPDVAVFLGVRERQRWPTFNVALEGARPALIIEVTSPETAHVDLARKVEEYAAVGVPLYVIVEIFYRRGRPQRRLIGRQLTPQGYQMLSPDERGRLWLAPIRAWLGIADGEIVCYDEAGTPLGDYAALTASLRAEIAARRAAEEQAADAERRASAAEARLRELEALLRQRESAE